MSLRFNFLGKTSIHLPDQSEIQLGRKNIGLLAYLAVAPNLTANRSVLASLLWSDRAEDQARDSLRQAISALRRAFQGIEPAPLSTTRTSIMLESNTFTADVIEMNTFAITNSTESREGIAELYVGSFLEDIDIRATVFEEWLANERVHFEKLAVRSLESLLDELAGRHDDTLRFEWASKLSAIDRFNEASARAKIEFYGARGESAKAAKEYETFKTALQNELDVQPSSSTTLSYQHATAGRDVNATSLEGLEPAPTSHQESGVGPPPVVAVASNNQSEGKRGYPRIAVLPLRNLSGDLDQIYFADGVTEDIIVSLSSFRALRVVSSQSSFSFRQAHHDPVDVASALKAGYLVSGSLRRANDRIRINVELVSGVSGENVWASRFDGTISEIFDIQDSISTSIANCVVGEVERTTVDGSRRVPTSHLSAYDYYLRGNEKLHQVRWHENVQARELYSEALTIDQQFPRAHAGMALAVFDSVFMGWDDVGLVEVGIEHANHASQLDPVDSHAQLALGMLSFLQRDFGSAEFHLNAAHRLNENDTDIMIYFAIVMIYAGRPKEAIAWVEKASRLNPLHPEFYYTVQGTAFFRAEAYAEAIASYKRRAGHDRMVLAYWAAAEYSNGDIAAAREIIKRLVEQDNQNHFGEKSVKDALEHEIGLYQHDSDSQIIADCFKELGLI